MVNSLFSLSLHIANPPIQDDSSLSPDGTPLLRLVNETLENNIYQSVCIPITNTNWAERWKRMCLTSEAGPSESLDKDVFMTDRDEDQRARIGNVTSSVTADKAEAHRLAETWRAGTSGRFQRNEVNLTRIEEAECTIGMASDWIELDSPDVWVRYDSELALKQELVHASYLGMQTVILPPPRNRAHAADYARAVNSCLDGSGISPFTHLSIRIPIYIPNATSTSSMIPSSSSTSMRMINGAAASPASIASFASNHAAPLSEADLNATWEIWDTIRGLCNYNNRLSLTLDLTAPLPTNTPNLTRWAAEPTRFIFLPASSFVANTRGYPVLAKSAQDFLKDMAQHRPTIILANTQAGLHPTGGANAYPQYIKHIEKSSSYFKALETPGTVESFAQGYHDYLQAPLQPLMDNLQSTTYETFEKDPVKYERYEEAVYRALLDRPSTCRTVICVAGSGRGGIVNRCVNAISRAEVDAHVYALEKNPNACITLEERKQYEWGDRVSLIFGDMRHVSLTEPVDILVSELLGSFGDNELSPECLDGAMRFLAADGISIPSSYTAHLAPLSSSKLWYETSNTSRERKHAETPYVVMFQAVKILSGDNGGLSGMCGPRIQETWEFVHPRPDILTNAQGLPITNTHNVRSAHLRFHIPHAGTLHGLAGYFEAVLYDDVGISIHPERMDEVSKDMLSWFPIFFPFKEPIYLPSNSELDVSMWRLTDTRKVWYEWCAEAFLPAALLSFPVEGSPSNGTIGSPRNDTGATADFLEVGERGEGGTRIKIAQTTLHNAGGVSSFVGL